MQSKANKTKSNLTGSTAISSAVLASAILTLGVMSNGPVSAQNANTISSSETTTNGGATLDGADSLTVDESGSITIDTAAQGPRGVEATGGGNTVSNDGTISVTTSAGSDTITDYDADAVGIAVDGGANTVTNAGQIRVEQTSTESAAQENSGIRATGSNGDVITNTGSISLFTSAYSAYPTFGIELRGASSADMSNTQVVNDGRIEITNDNSGGGRGIFADGTDAYPDTSRAENVILQNNGTIRIESDGGTNRGIWSEGINGEVDLINDGTISIAPGDGGNRGLFHTGIGDSENLYVRNSGTIDISILPGESGGGNRGVQASISGDGGPSSATVINTGSISISTPSGGSNRGIMLAFDYADQTYIINSGQITVDSTSGGNRGIQAYAYDLDIENSGRIVVTGTGGLRGIMARSGGDGYVLNTGYISVTGTGSTRGIELNDWDGDGDTTIVNRGTVIVSANSSTTNALEIYANGVGQTATITNSGTAISNHYSIDLDNEGGAAGVINLEAGSILAGDIEITDHSNATINFGPGLNAIVRMEDVTTGSDVPATINVANGDYTVQGDTIFVTSGGGVAVSGETARGVHDVSSMSLNVLAQNRDLMQSVTPQVTRGFTSQRRLAWGQAFGSTDIHEADGRSRSTGGLMVGMPIGAVAGVFLGAGRSSSDIGPDQSVASDHVFAGVQIAHDLGGLDIDASLTFGMAQHVSESLIADNRVAGGIAASESEFDSYYVMPAVTLANEIELERGTLTPSLRLSYVNIRESDRTDGFGPMATRLEGGTSHLYGARLQLDRGLADVETNGGLLSTNLRAGLDMAHLDGDATTAGLDQDWDTSRGFFGVEMTHRSNDGIAELTSSFEIGHDSDGRTDLRAGISLSVSF